MYSVLEMQLCLRCKPEVLPEVRGAMNKGDIVRNRFTGELGKITDVKGSIAPKHMTYMVLYPEPTDMYLGDTHILIPQSQLACWISLVRSSLQLE